MTSVSACLIVRDEAAQLADCLRSLRPWVDELCVVDTGSTDATIAIAQEASARVSHFTWVDDFAAARNASLELATHPWVLVVDADERLDGDSGPRLRAALDHAEAVAYTVLRHDLLPGGAVDTHPLLRLFRRLPEIRFERPVHESVDDAVARHGGPVLASGVELVHHGYLPEQLARVDKRARNLAILRHHVAGAGQGDAYTLFKLAVSLPADQLEERRDLCRRAREALGRIDDSERASTAFLGPLMVLQATTLADLGRLDAAARTLSAVPAPHHDHPTVRLGRADVAHRRGELATAIALADDVLASLPPGDQHSVVAVDGWRLRLAVEADHDPPRPFSAGGAPGHPAVLAGMARLLVAHGEWRRATQLIRQLLDAAPDLADVRLAAAEFAWFQGDRETAARLLDGIAPTSRVGRRARCWRQVLAGVLTDDSPPRDVVEAGLRRHLGAGARDDDDGLAGSSVASWQRRWARRQLAPPAW